MKVFDSLFKGGSEFLKSIKSDNRQQLAELEKLEQQIEELQKKEKQTPAPAVFLTNRMSLKFWLIGIFAIFIAYIAYQSLEVIYLIIAAFIVSLAIEAIIDFFQHRLRHRGISIILAYALLLIGVLAGLFFVVPFFLQQLSDIIVIVTNNISSIQDMLANKSLTDIITSSHWIP